MEDQAPEQAFEFQSEVPPELEGGSYANYLTVWHSPYEFTLDFAATQIPATDPDDPELPVEIRCRTVARVRIPVTLLFDVIRALNNEMTSYEQQFGEIRRPGEG